MSDLQDSVEFWQLPPGAQSCVGLFDILGFSEMNKRVSAGALGDALNSLEENLRSVVSQGSPSSPPVGHLLFSDSILLYTSQATAGHLATLIAASSLLIGSLAIEGIPVRGALTKGELAVSGDTRIFFGKSIIRAYELERGQMWLGAILDPTAFDTEEDKDGKALAAWNGHLRPYAVPWRDNPSPRHFEAIDWSSSAHARNHSLANRLHGFMGPPSLEGLAKQDAGIEFYHWAIKNDLDFAYWDAARRRVARRWHGKEASVVSEKNYHQYFSRIALERQAKTKSLQLPIHPLSPVAPGKIGEKA